MSYFKVEKSGCVVDRGLCQVRYDLFLDPEDYKYSEHHIQVPIMPEGGYPRQKEMSDAQKALQDFMQSTPKDAKGVPIITHKKYAELPEVLAVQAEQEAYTTWRNSLPTQWQNNPFCCHFVQFESNVTDEEILFVGELALDMAHTNWKKGALHENKNFPVSFTDDELHKAMSESRINDIKEKDFVAFEKTVPTNYSIRG